MSSPLPALPARAPFTAWLPATLRQAFALRRRHFGNLLTFDRPTQTLPVSLTGGLCGLACKHCDSHYLAHMAPLSAALTTTISSPADTAPKSYLVSGGLNREGRAPLKAHKAAIKELGKTGRLNFHVGLPEPADISFIAKAAGVVSLDFITHTPTIAEVYGTQRTGADYLQSYRALKQSGVRVAPHICIGLYKGRLEGEWEALEALANDPPDQVVFIVFIPTPGTPYAHLDPPPLAQVIGFLAAARLALPRTPLALGCMRPGGRYREALDRGAILAGINRLAQPTPAALALARRRGMQISESRECCAL